MVREETTLNNYVNYFICISWYFIDGDDFRLHILLLLLLFFIYSRSLHFYNRFDNMYNFTIKTPDCTPRRVCTWTITCNPAISCNPEAPALEWAELATVCPGLPHQAGSVEGSCHPQVLQGSCHPQVLQGRYRCRCRCRCRCPKASPPSSSCLLYTTLQ